MKVIPTRGARACPERYAAELLHDEPSMRIISFHLLPGQSVPSHRNRSTVTLQPIQGSGIFRGEHHECRLDAGDSVVYEPDEPHSIEALDGELRFLAIITPGPLSALNDSR